jgi:hypothetical protein
MIELQIESIEEPLLESGTAAALVLALVGRAQTMGFLPEHRANGVDLDRRFLGELARTLRRRGVAVAASAHLQRAARARAVDDDALVAALRETIAAVDASPLPEGEWEPARELVGEELLARLLQISVSSLRRYSAGERRTPDDVAWRLHYVARLLAALIGSYNAYGIRRWFVRPRTALGGVAPAVVLEQAESEADEKLDDVARLAEALTGAAAAA